MLEHDVANELFLIFPLFLLRILSFTMMGKSLELEFIFAYPKVLYIANSHIYTIELNTD
jgi:hypothetical protein